MLPSPALKPETARRAGAGEVVGLIAAHHEARQIFEVVRGARPHLGRCLVVADGCHDDTAARARAAGAEVLEIPQRGGKGAALIAGWNHLLQDESVAAVLMLDGDGQHCASDIPAFLESWSHGSADLLIGERSFTDAAMPWARRLTNRFMSAVIRKLVNSSCRDTQCGFRLASREFLTSRKWRAAHFEVESEMVLHAGNSGWTIANIPVRTIYRGRGSHIRVMPDLMRWLRLLGYEAKAMAAGSRR